MAETYVLAQDVIVPAGTKLHPPPARSTRWGKDCGLGFHDLVSQIGESREMSLAKTKIEEAVMWAVKHITR